MAEPVAYQDIVAVVSCGVRLANEYLARGYTLLSVGDWATESPMRPVADGTQRTYVRRGVTCVVGRTEGVEPYNPDEHPGVGLPLSPE